MFGMYVEQELNRKHVLSFDQFVGFLPRSGDIYYTFYLFVQHFHEAPIKRNNVVILSVHKHTTYANIAFSFVHRTINEWNKLSIDCEILLELSSKYVKC